LDGNLLLSMGSTHAEHGITRTLLPIDYAITFPTPDDTRLYFVALLFAGAATAFGHQGIEAVQNRDWGTSTSYLATRQGARIESSNAPGWLLPVMKMTGMATPKAALKIRGPKERGAGGGTLGQTTRGVD
jgi:hypothetical protein